MKQNTWMKPTMSLVVSLVLVLLMGLAAMPTEAQPGEAKVQRVIFASAGIDETNRFWVVSRPNQLQNDPYLETLLDLDPKTGAFIPRLAEKWEASPDMKEWTLFLRKGVPFHFGYGEFTARDVVHSHALMLREEAVATFVGMWRNVEEVKVINDYQVVFRMKGPATTLPYALSRSGDLRMVSKAQWDKEGLEGFEKRPAGTGSYQYVSRQLGQSIVFERVENHWSGIRPDVQGIGDPHRPGRIDPTGHAAEWGGPHRGSGARAPGRRRETRHADPRREPRGRVGVGLFRRPVPYPWGPEIQSGCALERPACPAGDEHGHQPSRSAGASLSQARASRCT